jgi:hypothetical protein
VPPPPKQRCCAAISFLREYFNYATRPIDEQFMGYPDGFALVVASAARAGTKIFDHRELISHASPLAVRG